MEMIKNAMGLLLLLFCLVFSAAGEVVFSENFSDSSAAGNWKLSSERHGENYSHAGFGKGVLMLQDFDYRDSPAVAESPEFAVGKAWKIEFDFYFTPPVWGKQNQPYSVVMQLLDKDGVVVADLSVQYKRLVPGGTFPGALPVKDNSWYRLSVTSGYGDGLYDLAITDSASGECRTAGELPLKSAGAPARIRFSVVPGWDTCGVLQIANLAVSDLGVPAKRIRPVIGQLENELLRLRFHANGGTGIEFRNSVKEEWAHLGILKAPELPDAPASPDHFQAIKLKDDNPVLPDIDFEMIPTATDVVGTDNKVLGVAAVDKEGKQLYLMQWTLFPKSVRLRVYPSWQVEGKWEENLGAMHFIPAPDMKETRRFSPERSLLHPLGGVPRDVRRGQAIEFGNGKNHATFACNGESPSYWSFWRDKKLRFEIRKCHLPWAPVFYSGVLALSVQDHEDSRWREAIARAGDERLLMDVTSADPFFVRKDPGTYELTAHVVNFFRKPQRVHFRYTAHDFDGRVLKKETLSRILQPEEEHAFPVSVELKQTGPVFFDIYAMSEFAGDYRRICGGVLPEYDFKAGRESRIGIVGWRGSAGEVTEPRTPELLFRMMRRIGVSTIRQSHPYEHIAQKYGLRTWYHNNIGDSASLEAYVKGARNWLSDPKALSRWMLGNLKLTHDTGSEVFEFSNEWNLYGGEQKAVRAKAYADFAKVLRKTRDQYYPDIKLTGLTVCNGDMPYMQKVYEQGAWDDFDYLAFHATGVTRSPETDDSYWSYIRTLRAVREAARRFGDKPLYLTEFYSPTAPNMLITNNERIAATDIGIQVGLAVAADVKNIMYYTFNDLETGALIHPDNNISLQRECHFGLFHRNWMPKLPLWAWQTAARFFDPGKFLGDLQFDDPDARGLLFDRGPNGKFALLWSRKDGLRKQEAPIQQGFHLQPWIPADLNAPLELTVDAMNRQCVWVTDAVGRTRRVAANSDGKVVLPLTEAPLYVEGARLIPTKGPVYRMLSPDASPAEWIRLE